MSDEKPSRLKNLGYAAFAGQAGCAALVIILVALFLGLWLDSLFGRRGPFTIGLLLLSVPLSLFVMLRFALALINQIQAQPEDEAEWLSNKEENL